MYKHLYEKKYKECLLITYGMKTDQIAREINERRLYVRRDGQPVSDKQVYAVIMAHPETFVKADGRIRLMI